MIVNYSIQKTKGAVTYCSYCPYKTMISTNFKTHMLTHTGLRPHVCFMCNKSFNQKVHLKTHLRIHSGERPYVCETCGKRFVQQAHLRNHQLVHIKEAGEPHFV
ncbi:hypothetical protein TNCV_3916321 [Trichonephila clavipes]|nr:hypothetical protein TNCV_3916321 [Trichonephila clavipes]